MQATYADDWEGVANEFKKGWSQGKLVNAYISYDLGIGFNTENKGDYEEIIKTIVETAPLPTIEKSKEIPIAFTIRPIFIRVNKARALTEKDKPIELAVAVVGKNVIEENGALKSSDFVSTSFSISDIHLEKNITSLPQSSGLLVYPSEGSLVTEIDVSVVETGTAAGDTDKANAEILALKQIISSEAKKYLDERFKDTPK